MEVVESLLLARDIEHGYTWTLASRLGKILVTAEDIFGPRDTSYMLLGVEFNTRVQPQIWFPGNRKQIVIQLSRQAALDEREAVFELGQECIHLLAPTGGVAASVLEEGMGTVLSIRVMREFGFTPPTPSQPQYTKAWDLVEQLLKIDPHIIRRLREHQPSVSRLTKDDLVRANPAVPGPLAEELTHRF